MADPLSFRWPPEFIAEVDRRRGSVPRSAYVRESLEGRWALEAGLGHEATVRLSEAVVDTDARSQRGDVGGSPVEGPHPAQPRASVPRPRVETKEMLDRARQRRLNEMKERRG